MATNRTRSAAELGVTNVLDLVTRVFEIEGTPRGEEFDILCPDPNHEDRRPSASVNLVTGFWHCFSCGAGGDLIGLGARALGKERETVEELLRPTSVDALLAILRSRHVPRRKKQRVATLPVPGDYLDEPLDELYERGFTRTTLDRWNVRYVPTAALEGHNGPFNIYASIGIPIMDEHARMLAWCYRRTDASPQWQPRYLYTGGAGLIRETWFGLQHHARARDIVIVEGALDAMWCDQVGIPALALLGAAMGDRKLMLLRRYDSVTLLGDFDTGGVQAVRRIGNAIGGIVPVRVAQYSKWMLPPRAKKADPQDLHPVDVEVIVERALPWATFVVAQ